jgi:hypothetical protein
MKDCAGGMAALGLGQDGGILVTPGCVFCPAQWTLSYTGFQAPGDLQGSQPRGLCPELGIGSRCGSQNGEGWRRTN